MTTRVIRFSSVGIQASPSTDNRPLRNHGSPCRSVHSDLPTDSVGMMLRIENGDSSCCVLGCLLLLSAESGLALVGLFTFSGFSLICLLRTEEARSEKRDRLRFQAFRDHLVDVGGQSRTTQDFFQLRAHQLLAVLIVSLPASERGDQSSCDLRIPLV
jgi:hypothetical protein